MRLRKKPPPGGGLFRFTQVPFEGAAGDGAETARTLHPGAKLLCAAVFIVTVVSFRPGDLAGLAAMAFYPALMLTLSGLSARAVFPRSCAALPFALALGVSGAFFQRTPLFGIGSFVVTTGMVSCVSLVLKTLLSVSSLVLLGGTTPPRLLVDALTRAGLPKILALQFNMTGRYIAVLTSEAASMLTAYQLRSRRRVKGVAIRDSGSFLGQLLLRGFDRAGRVYDAMRLRGFDGTFRAGEDEGAAAWTLKDTVFTLGVTSAVILARITHPVSLFADWARGLAGGFR